MRFRFEAACAELAIWLHERCPLSLVNGDHRGYCGVDSSQHSSGLVFGVVVQFYVLGVLFYSGKQEKA